MCGRIGTRHESFDAGSVCRSTRTNVRVFHSLLPGRNICLPVFLSELHARDVRVCTWVYMRSSKCIVRRHLCMRNYVHDALAHDMRLCIKKRFAKSAGQWRKVGGLCARPIKKAEFHGWSFKGGISQPAGRARGRVQLEEDEGRTY